MTTNSKLDDCRTTIFAAWNNVLDELCVEDIERLAHYMSHDVAMIRREAALQRAAEARDASLDDSVSGVMSLPALPVLPPAPGGSWQPIQKTHLENATRMPRDVPL